MADTTSKTNSSSLVKSKKKLGTFFDALPVGLKASSRRMQVYGELLLNTIIELNLYPDDPLCSKAGVAALKNALRYYNIGVGSLAEPFTGTTDLDGMSESYKAHVEHGLDLLAKAGSGENLDEKDALQWQVMRDVLASHHERWDGSGYPKGMRETAIPLAARICAVCNSFDNLTTSDADRDKMTTEAAISEIKRFSGTYFDPAVVDALKRSMDQINEILENGTVAKATAGNSSVRAIEQLYRPMYDYGNHTVYGYDTDIRLNDPEMGVIPSETFIPIAERSNKINELAKWSIEEACSTIVHLKENNRFTGEFFIFLSIKSLLKKNFLENVVWIVTKYGLESREICFVISENVLSFNMKTLGEALNLIHGLGFKLAIGNFGSEAVNLSVLQKLDVDYLILNSEFVADILVSVRAKKIVASVVELAKQLDLTVMADGVVNKEQAKELFGMGCNIMCGSYYGRYTAVTII